MIRSPFKEADLKTCGIFSLSCPDDKSQETQLKRRGPDNKLPASPTGQLPSPIEGEEASSVIGRDPRGRTVGGK